MARVYLSCSSMRPRIRGYIYGGRLSVFMRQMRCRKARAWRYCCSEFPGKTDVAVIHGCRTPIKIEAMPQRLLTGWAPVVG